MGSKRADDWPVAMKDLDLESQALKRSLEATSTSTLFEDQPKPEKGQERAESEL